MPSTIISSNGNCSEEEISAFKQLIYEYYAQEGRTFVWRNALNPYHILVSEIMLQQTQTYRVEDKFKQFMQAIPTLADLASIPTADLIKLWQGLGYNRRALQLKLMAERIMNEFGGSVPDTEEVLVTFKGIGPATAASICAFAFNKPTVFIETNIRAVFIHFFFHKNDSVTDKQLLPLIEKTVDKNEPRKWYYALMDYGVMLKKKYSNPSRKSAHYTRQSRFEGSDRQVRGQILKVLVDQPFVQEEQFVQMVNREADITKKILIALENEGFIKKINGFYHLC